MTYSLRSLLLLACLLGCTSAFLPFSVRNSKTVAWGTSTALRLHRETVTMMPATIEREAVKVGGPAVLERPETERKERVDDPSKQRKRMGNEAWEVRIYNDGLNTREHVARSLVQVTGMSEMDAYQTMMQAHQNGIAVVGRWPYEEAEMYQDALQKNGIVCDIVPVDEDS